MIKPAICFGLGLILFGLSSCLNDEPFKRAYTGYSPQAEYDDWALSDPSTENMDSEMVNRAYQLVYRDNRFTMARSLIVLRHGRIVAEAYPNDPGDIDRIANIQSMTKSFTSVLTGIALQQGVFDSVNQTLESIYPELFIDHPEKKSMTLRHALTMTTGIDFINSTHTQGLYETEGNPVSYVLSRQQTYEPGIVFKYHDGAPQLVSGAIQKMTGENLASFADRNLFGPLGITDWKWESAKDQSTFGAFSLFLKPRDLARFGQLLLQNGRWDDHQIVDSTWIESVAAPQVNSGALGTPYGYYFWIYPAYEAFGADGHGGPRVMVFPEKELVIVYTAWGYTSGEFFDNLNEVVDLILASCR
jgi:CubicO group peptidase (beta-lactamase class C family)